jgi:hypothetical protein
MNNISMSTVGTILTIKVDLSKDFGLSKSGKTISIASTLGNKRVKEDENVFIGVNVYKSR